MALNHGALVGEDSNVRRQVIERSSNRSRDRSIRLRRDSRLRRQARPAARLPPSRRLRGEVSRAQATSAAVGAHDSIASPNVRDGSRAAIRRTRLQSNQPIPESLIVLSRALNRTHEIAPSLHKGVPLNCGHRRV
jgi:hypothetical protein